MSGNEYRVGKGRVETNIGKQWGHDNRRKSLWGAPLDKLELPGVFPLPASPQCATYSNLFQRPFRLLVSRSIPYHHSFYEWAELEANWVDTTHLFLKELGENELRE